MLPVFFVWTCFITLLLDLDLSTLPRCGHLAVHSTKFVHNFCKLCYKESWLFLMIRRRFVRLIVIWDYSRLRIIRIRLIRKSGSTEVISKSRICFLSFPCILLRFIRIIRKSGLSERILDTLRVYIRYIYFVLPEHSCRRKIRF